MTQLSITIPITKRRKVVLTVEEAREVQRQLNEIFPETKQVPEKWMGVPLQGLHPNTIQMPGLVNPCVNNSATPPPPQPTTTCNESTNSRSHPAPHQAS